MTAVAEDAPEGRVTRSRGAGAPAYDGRAIIYCEGAFATTNGKTAHGLVRRSHRYEVLSVVDSTCAGLDAGRMLDRKPNGIAIHASLGEALSASRGLARPATHVVMGLAPDGGRLPPEARQDMREALLAGLNITSGLHDYLGEDPELSSLAALLGREILDVRKTPPREDLHSFRGVIDDVRALRIAVLGTDSAVGKRTTAWMLVDAFRAAGHVTELVGTGQTAWLQGARFGLILDSMINDFVAGEIEHAVWQAWRSTDAEVLVIEGQGSLMNPAYPGGYEILAAGRPDMVVLQHAPGRLEYDGFSGYPIHPLERQIRAIETVSDRPVVAITLNHEGIEPHEIPAVCDRLERQTGLPVADPLLAPLDRVVSRLQERIRTPVGV